MIVYYLEKVRFRKHPTARAKVFRGTVQFYDDSKARAMKLGTGVVGRQLTIFRATVFDDATEPPTLIRWDYGFSELEQRGAKLPIHYTDTVGNIRRLKDDAIVFEGPSAGAVVVPQPGSHRWVRI